MVSDILVGGCFTIIQHLCCGRCKIVDGIVVYLRVDTPIDISKPYNPQDYYDMTYYEHGEVSYDFIENHNCMFCEQSDNIYLERINDDGTPSL